MRVICNTGPIIGLLAINRINLIHELFGEVVMPQGVYAELFHPDHLLPQNALEVTRLIDTGVITLYSVQNADLVRNLTGRLHQGELEVIVGAKELQIDLAIIDEISARKFASQFLIDTIGLIGILKLAKQNKLIQSVKPELDILRSGGYRISDKLYQETLQQLGEICPRPSTSGSGA